MKKFNINKIKNLKELGTKELNETKGGTWGYDIGWILGHSIAGHFMVGNYGGYADAVAAYAEHYSNP